MSLFGKMKAGLKSVSNRVTGGYGEVSLALREPTVFVGGQVVALVTVTAKDDLKVTKITAKLRSVERASYSDEYEENIHAECRVNETTFDQEIELQGEFEMTAGESKEYEAVFQLPEDSRPSFKGERLSHIYNLSVEVDIPWGADLRANEDIQVLPAVVEEPPRELKRVQQNCYCKAALTISNAKVNSGSYIQYSLIVAPLEQIKIEGVHIGLKAVEFMDATLSHWNPLSYDEEGEEEERTVSHREQGTIEIVSYEEYKTYLERHLIDKPSPLINTVTIPEDLSGTYRGDGVSSRCFLVATIEIENSEPIEFCEEVVIQAAGSSNDV